MHEENPVGKIEPIKHGNRPLPPGADPVKCDHRPECTGCTFPAHGFVCHFADGNCLRFPRGVPNE